MKAKAQGGSTCQLASVKGYDMLIEPFAMTGEILTFDLVRRKVTKHRRSSLPQCQAQAPEETPWKRGCHPSCPT